MSNSIFQTITVVILAAHIAALLAAVVFRRGPGTMLALNLTVCACVLLIASARARFAIAAVDWPYLAMVVIEIAAVVAAIAGLRHDRAGVIVSWIVFSLHGLAAAAAVGFAFLFKMTRLF